MKVLSFPDRDAWLDARRGRITGTRVGKLFSKRDKKPIQGYYELIAERVGVPASQENVMDRGTRLEDEAIAKFAEKTGKKVNNDLVIWHRDEDERIAVSPDGSIGKSVAVEVKCLSSASHIEAWLTQTIPSEYEYQVLQYFIVNDKLKTVHFVFYDPRMPVDLFWIDVQRAVVAEKVAEYLTLEKDVLAQIAEIEARVTF